MKRYCQFIAILIYVLFNCTFIKAQDTLTEDKKLYYRLTLGAGIGAGYPQQDGFGTGGTLEFALQKQKNAYSIGVRGIEEFEIFAYSNVPNSINSIDITYGKVFKNKSFYTSISAGAGLVTGVQKGKFISGSGGWFNSNSNYEKITHHTIGFPISAKIFWVPLSFTGVGLELYANINSKNTFYGINLCRQFGKLRPPIKNNRHLAEKILLLILL